MIYSFLYQQDIYWWNLYYTAVLCYHPKPSANGWTNFNRIEKHHQSDDSQETQEDIKY